MSEAQEEIEVVLPQGKGEVLSVAPAAVDVADQPDPDGEEVAAEVKEKIKLFGREFEDEAQAESYVRQVEQENLQIKSYNEGLLAGTHRQATPPVEEQAPEDPLADITEDGFWQNPKDALAKVYKKAKEDAQKEINQTVTKRTQYEKAWSDFYDDNPDLRGKEKYINLILAENQESIGNMELSEGFRTLAMKTREELNMAGKVTKELTNKGKPTPTGAPKNVTPKEKEPEYLDLGEHMRRIRKQRGLTR